MDPVIAAALIKNFGVPIIMAIIRAHHNASNGTLPTEAQIVAALPSDAKLYSAIGQSLVDEIKGRTPAPGTATSPTK